MMRPLPSALLLITASLITRAPLVAQDKPVPVWHLVEEWRVGGDPDGPHSFDAVSGLALLPNGGFVHSNGRTEVLQFLNARGEGVKSVGRKGSGPGDLSFNNGLAVRPNGDVVVNDRGNGRFSIFSSAGKFLSTTKLDMSRSSAGESWNAIFLKDGRLVERIGLLWTAGKYSQTLLWSADFKHSTEIHPEECESTAAAESERITVPLRAPDGHLVYNYTMLYAKPTYGVAYDPAGFVWTQRSLDSNEIVRRPLTSCQVTATIKLPGRQIPADARATAIIQKALTSAATQAKAVPPKDVKFPTRLPWFEAIQVDRLGNVWVERLGEKLNAEMDVYDNQGHHIASVTEPLPVRSRGRTMLITADHVYGFDYDKDGVGYLVSLKIVR